MGCKEITAEYKIHLINKRIKQLKEYFDDDFNKELFYCEVIEWNRILDKTKDLNMSNIISIKCCYENILEVLKKDDGLKYNLENQIQVKSVEIDELLGKINSLLDFAEDTENMPFLLILKVLINLLNELIAKF